MYSPVRYGYNESHFYILTVIKLLCEFSSRGTTIFVFYSDFIRILQFLFVFQQCKEFVFILEIKNITIVEGFSILFLF